METRNKVTQHQLGQIKQKLSKLSQKFELVAAGFILRFTRNLNTRNLKIAPTIILLSLLVTHYSLLITHSLSLCFDKKKWFTVHSPRFIGLKIKNVIPAKLVLAKAGSRNPEIRSRESEM